MLDPVGLGAADEVTRGPSQCQWSPWGSQPTDSVGLGLVGVAIPSWPSACEVVAVAAAEVAGAGPVQCLTDMLILDSPPIKHGRAEFLPMVTMRLTSH